MTVYAGLFSVEDFGANTALGIKLGYHVNEDVLVEFDYGFSDVGQTSFEVLSGGAPLLSDKERELEYYLINIGFKLLPGEAFFTDSSTLGYLGRQIFGKRISSEYRYYWSIFKLPARGAEYPLTSAEVTLIRFGND